jgi:hypothetical protein
VQAASDLRRRLPVGDQHEDLALPAAQLRPLVARPQADLLGDAGLRGGVEDRLAARDRGDRPADDRWLGVLGQIAGRALGDRVVRVDRGDLRGQQQESRRARRRQPDEPCVGDRDVRRQPLDRRGQLRSVVHLGDQLQLAVQPDRTRESIAEQWLGVSRDHADRAGSARRGRGRHGHPVPECLLQQGTSLHCSGQVPP